MIYGNDNASNDPNAKVVSNIIKTDNFSSLYLWYNERYTDGKFKYKQYSFRYGGNSLGPRGQNYVMLQLQKE